MLERFQGSVFRSGIAAVALVLALGACSDANKPLQPSADKVASGSAAPPAPSGVAEAALKKLAIPGLTSRENNELQTQLAKLNAPCGEPISLAVCIAEDRNCKACVPAGKWIGKLVRMGVPDSQIKEIYEARFDPKAVKNIDYGSSPTKGPDDAIVTIVEWADFQCSACLGYKPLLELMLERFPGQVRLVFKHFPLSKHPLAKGAAQAAVAAHNQGKFWEMYEKLFAAQESGQLAPQDLNAMAKKLKLDMDKFRKDFSSPETLKTVEEDMKQAEALGLEGTPFLWINGRQFEIDPREMEEWIAMDIELAGKTPAKPSERYAELAKEIGLDVGPSPDGSASAGAAPSASAPVAPSAAPSAGPAPSASAQPGK
ncbi:MAG: thioredoxin domain-containing protein [Polyangiaceae bacterium]|nr:thioredoxin domain-containing protein [Polyangiaceae bacterium]